MTKFEKKLDALFWFILSIIPIIAYFCTSFHNPTVVEFNSFIQQFNYPFISDIFNQIFTGTLLLPSFLVNYLSYFCAVAVIHVFVDVVIFIPRFAHCLSERFLHHE